MSTTTYTPSTADIRPTRGIWDLPAWFAPALMALVVEVFILIALGGFVRLMNAGLACPDWPLCFGDYIPDYHPQVYLEFIHRAMAGLVMLTTMALSVALWKSAAPRSLKWLMTGAALLVVAQAVFGGLTVLLQLHAGVVSTHLALGTSFFLLLLWCHLTVKQVSRASDQATSQWLFWPALFVMAAVYGQILLGGLVASNYAGHVCPDFPKCQGQWFPSFSGMVGLHVWHRLGAYSVFLLVMTYALVLRRYSSSRRLRRWSGWMVACVSVQVGLGVSNVLLLTPPAVGVAHLAMATFILSLGLRQIFILRP